MEAIWPFIVGAAATYLPMLVTHILNRRDKRDERTNARVDMHRSELRDAYATFIATMSKFLDAGALLIGMRQALKSQGDDAFNRAISNGKDRTQAEQIRSAAGNRELIAKSRMQFDVFAGLSTEAETAGARVVLLEDRPEFSAEVVSLIQTALVPAETPDDYERFLADLKAVRSRLEALVRALAGGFAPERWHRGQLKLGSSTPPLLPPGKKT